VERHTLNEVASGSLGIVIVADPPAATVTCVLVETTFSSSGP
jgi:hypothetical protein